MKTLIDMTTTIKLAMLGSVLALAAGPASAETFDLCAEQTTKIMPDGSSVPMWGYVLDTDAGTAGCQGDIEIPGPRLTVTDGSLTINLTNNLPEPTSIVVSGLAMPDGSSPTWDDNSTGPRCVDSLNCTPAEMAKKVRSFGNETAGGATGSYVWSSVPPGTYIYYPGTHPQKQVYMGLYGAVTQDAAAATLTTPAEAYPGVQYLNEVVLFYSEIDPDLNASIAELHAPTGLVEPYSTSIEYQAKWFLVNGEPYSTDCTDDFMGIPPVAGSDGLDDASGYPCGNMIQTADITVGTDGSPLAANQKTLLRFLSTAGETHVPTLQGLHMTIYAEDGRPYSWEDTAAGTSGPAPREQYSVMLPPLKTKDAILKAPQGRYALYDGNGYMTNPTDPNDFDHSDPVGGMLRFLAFGPASVVNLPPAADANGPYSAVLGSPVVFDGTGSSDPDGTIASYDWDYGDGSPVAVNAGATPSHTYAAVGSYIVTLTVTDDLGASDTATTTAVIAANVAPTADPNGPYSQVLGLPILFDGTGSSDIDGTIASYDWDYGDGSPVAVNAGPTPSYTYAAAGTYTVTLTVTDDLGAMHSATTTAVIAANVAPTADPNGPYSGVTNAAVSFDGTGSFDTDGTIVSYEWDFDASDGIQLDGTGPTPSNTYAAAGLYTVTLTVTDNAGASDTATTTADISAANLPPIAEAGGPYSVSLVMDGGTVAFDGTGSSDPDGSIASYDWDYGDGSPIAVNAGATPSHTYAAASTYVVTLTVTDNLGATATDTAIASVVGNQAPVAVNETVAVPRLGSTAIDVLANDYDIDGTIDPATIVITQQPSTGSAAVVGGQIVYTPPNGNSPIRNALFVKYTVADNLGAVSNVATVTINVIR